MSGFLLRALAFCKDIALPFILKNIKPLLIAAAVATVMFFVTGFFVLREKLHDTEAELERAKAQVAQLEKDVKDITSTHIDLAKKNEELRHKSDELAQQLERRGKKSISELAKKKAKLVENALNNGTDKALRCIEVMSEGGDC